MLVRLVSDFLDKYWTFEYNNVIILEIRFFPLPGVCWGFYFILVVIYCLLCIVVACLCAEDQPVVLT